MKPSWRAHLAAWAVRRRVKPALGDMRDIARVRRVFDQSLPAPRGVRYTPATLGGVPGEWVEAVRRAPAGAAAAAAAWGAPPAGAEATTLLYLHGGGFVGCSARTHRPLTAALARQGLRLFVPDYRLAPEHPYPAAVDDVQAAWRALRAAVPGRLAVAGDSAGGNLALGLMLALREAGQALPVAAALFSPAVDLTGGSASLVDNADRDPMFRGEFLDHLADAYMAGADRAQPLASPLLGALHGLPPLLLQVGEDEVLRDDSLRLAQKAREAGVAVTLQVFPKVPHVWQLLGWLPEARRALRDAAAFLQTASPAQAEQHDVLIVGAGLSGIGAAVHLQRQCPGLGYAVLEARGALGGTWDLFRYPGVRSDSDMHTLGYDFKPWREARAIADGPAIRRYIAETAAEHGIDRHIRLQHRVVGADWSARDALWTVRVERGPARQPGTLRARFLLFCSGYYSYAQGRRPAFPGEAQFAGPVLHPQAWPEGLATAGRRVVVIGSGATAVTLVPALARDAAHVTMLQRSPSYLFARPSVDPVAERLRRWLPPGPAGRLVRLKNVALGMYFYRLARRHPERAKARLVGLVREQLGPGFDVDRHFTPSYKPWDQRLCLVPDGDLFQALREGRASVVTDHIETFTPRGIRLRSGAEIEADIVVAATGLQLNVLGDVRISLDGVPCDLSRALVYKGVMYSGLPNLANTFGYTNASWTLKADLSARYVARLLAYLRRRGLAAATPRADAEVVPAPLLEFSSGYVQRAVDRLPKQGDRRPWQLFQNYALDLLMLRLGRIDDGVLVFGRPAAGGSARPHPLEPAR
ncbi:MAG: alpha/beta hydrolase fold domain-containing protein [Burkholderiales bacterium]|nr:alpha/beta hydrolase fold domain-containing protein [Burkholderiales bacterium]